MIVSEGHWIRRSESLTHEVLNFVEGRPRPSRGIRILDKYSPRDGRLLYQFSAGDDTDVKEAVSSASHAFVDGRWSRLPVSRRSEVLVKLAALIESHREELALLECLDVGKPISDALNFDVPAAAATIRFNAEAADKMHSKVYGADTSSLSFELRRPIGVVAGIVGWNFPLALAAQKIGPVLATGNCLVLKPSELTSLTTALIANLALEAGLPEGVLNVVHGDAHVGASLAHHKDVNLLTFTGSTRTGKEILVAAGHSNMKRLILECGGKAPNIVFEDCPCLDSVADAIIASGFRNQGQVCVASSRILVHESLKDELLKGLIYRASHLRPGDPLKSDTKFGSLVSQAHKRKVLDYIDIGSQEGARLAYRSDSPPPFPGGYYVAPIIFDQVTPKLRIAQEEIFGPVLSIISFRDESEAIRVANETSYGLSAVVWTRDMARAHRISQEIDAGWIVVNSTDRARGGLAEGALVVGGHKESGFGVEGGIEGLEAYTNKTTVQFFM